MKKLARPRVRKPEDNLGRQYPRERWSPELRSAVDREARLLRATRFLTWPFDAAVARITRRQAATAWDAAHYRDWTREELVWRVLFLQGAGRNAWAAHVVTLRWLAPLAALMGFSLGMVVR
jgi:hypothetical protein